jgi:hypothetical protein
MRREIGEHLYPNGNSRGQDFQGLMELRTPANWFSNHGKCTFSVGVAMKSEEEKWKLRMLTLGSTSIHAQFENAEI